MKVIHEPSATTTGCIFVPTMGALHAGHAALVRHACTLAETEASARVNRPPVVVSIFVNPTQFNDPADLERYPRTLDADLELCRSAGADIVFTPSVQTVYPGGARSEPNATVAVPPLPAVASEPKLEDAHRPGHFAGVCQVVSRLFDLVQPSAAVFGEKDWQQLQVITAMTASQHRPTRIIPSPTVREPDGLAMSSRNRFLSHAERRIAPALYQALNLANQHRSPADAEHAMRTHLTNNTLAVEYAVVRDAQTLLPLDPGSSRPARCLIAARLSSIRLIDNAPWTPHT